MLAIKKRLVGLPNTNEAFQMLKAFEYLYENQALSSVGLTGGASATVTTANAISAMVGAQLKAVNSGQAFALNGPTIPNAGAVNQVWIFTMDGNGLFYTLPGIPAATLATVSLPVVPDTQVVLGMLVLSNSSAGNFVPGTTLLNVAGLNTVFNNTVGPFFPIQLL